MALLHAVLERGWRLLVPSQYRIQLGKAEDLLRVLSCTVARASRAELTATTVQNGLINIAFWRMHVTPC